MATTRAIVLVALLIWAALTPSFLSAPSLTALLTTASVIGCLSAGMTFITISGNVMSFALGATAASSAVVFLLLLNATGLVPALIGALLFGGAVTGFQGLIVGWIRANPIIVSIAANVLIYGAFTWLTGNELVNADANAGHGVFKGVVGGIPIEFLIFITAVATRSDRSFVHGFRSKSIANRERIAGRRGRGLANHTRRLRRLLLRRCLERAFRHPAGDQI